MIGRDDPLALLRPAVGRCLGAAFVTHVLDERFMEQVLAALLPIEADPEADPRFFIDEGRRRLRQTPVVVLADARQYTGGHRLPFEVVLAPWDTRVHARLGLLLFGDHARLFSGSGNLTRGGFGNNAELFTWSTLQYDRDLAPIRKVVDLFTTCGAAGEGWSRFWAQLEVLLPQVGARRSRGAKGRGRAAPGGEAELLVGADVVAQFLERIPRRAVIESVAMSAAASPEDEPADLSPFVGQVGEWLRRRKARRAPLHMVLPWPNAHGPRPADGRELEDAVGRVAAFRDGERIAWGEVETVAGDGVTLVTGARRRTVARETGQPGPGSPGLWIYSEALGAGPVEALEELAAACDVAWWLWPEYLPGDPRRRPLHGAWLLVQVREGRARRSHLLTGAFEPALPAGQELVTAGMALSPKRPLLLADLAPDAVRAPTEGFYLQEAWLPPARQVPPPPATDCTYDAARRTLRIGWRAGTRKVKATYTHPADERVLADGSPGLETLVRDFEVDRHSAEISVQQGEHVWFLPLSISNLAHLPADEGPRPATLRELAAHHAGGRGAGHGDADDDGASPTPASLATAPREVFAAIAALREEIEAAASLGELEVLLAGTFGVQVMAELLAPGADPSLLRAEAWFYGQELLRMLRGLRLGDGAAARARRERLRPLLDELGRGFAAAAPKDDPAAAAARRFYGGPR